MILEPRGDLDVAQVRYPFFRRASVRARQIEVRVVVKYEACLGGLRRWRSNQLRERSRPADLARTGRERAQEPCPGRFLRVFSGTDGQGNRAIVRRVFERD